MEERYERDFKGVWIPKEIWLSKNLSLQEKLFYVEINSLDKSDRGCYASNNYFAQFFNLTKARCSQVITSLLEKDLITISLQRENNAITERNIKINKGINFSKEGSKPPKQGGSKFSKEGSKKSSSIIIYKNNIKRNLKVSSVKFDNLTQDEQNNNSNISSSLVIKRNKPPKIKKKQQAKEQTPNLDRPIKPSDFELVWERYPRKVKKGDAENKWKAMCSHSNKRKPTLKEVLKAIRVQSATKQWQDKGFIPHFKTWINNTRWTEDPVVMDEEYDLRNKQTPNTIKVKNPRHYDASQEEIDYYNNLIKSKTTVID